MGSVALGWNLFWCVLATLETKLERVESCSGLGLASSCCYIQQQQLVGLLVFIRP